MLAKPERKDAVRSRSTLLVAARRVFSEHGAHAPLELVIEAAGVGRGTLYRHFPDRISLIVALFGAEIDTLSVVMASAEPEQRIEVLLGHCINRPNTRPYPTNPSLNALANRAPSTQDFLALDWHPRCRSGAVHR